ncbi:MAG: hypothetical protein K9M49_02685, partial [Candidatus Marinimicrobia bacterium]|nr:hypothetical protein [Candidatus Neomarinimicrobiota bacterium]
LLGIVFRDLEDAHHTDLSSHWKFGIAYNAALKLCTCLLYAEGFRPERNLAHFRTLQSLPLILGDDRADDTAYLDACRMKRNTLEYDMAGVTTDADAAELLAFALDFRDDVINWLQSNHPDLLLSE